MFESIHNYFGSLLPMAGFIACGIFTTFKYSFISVLLGFILGIMLAVCKLSKHKMLRYLANFYTSIFRGTPLLIQLSVVYYGIPSVCNIHISIFAGGIIAFSMNSAAYVSEIIRAGIVSIDKGQFEAAKALNIAPYYLYKDIIIPQAISNIIPALINELINMLKESSMISILGEADLIYRAQLVAAETYQYFTPMLIAASYYYLMVMLLSSLAKILERKLKI